VLKSMTAFSRVQQANEFGSITWEIRSVNHRYLEPSLKLPDDFRQLEPEIRKQLNRFLKRGKIDINLRYRLILQDSGEINLQEDLVRQLRKLEQRVLNIVHEGNSMSVADILRWPGVVAETDIDFSPLMTLAKSSLTPALQQLVETRETEGAALLQMIESRCDKISNIVEQLKLRRPEVMEGLRDKWQQNLQEKLSQWTEQADNGRLEQEMVILAQKLDVAEELDRLQTHVVEVKKVLQRDEPVGRRLDFLMQELNREANTLSSKSQDSETTQMAVDLKVLIEQIREQVQNIE